MKTRESKSGAFTLIELMVVVAILILMLGWGVPNMLRTVEKVGINKAVADLMEGCKQARAYAILSGNPSALVIRAEDGQMTVRKAAGPRLMRASGGEFGSESNASTRKKKAENQLDSFRAALADEVRIELLFVNFIDQELFSEAIIRFYPNGTSDEFTIVMEVADEWRKVSLDPITAIANVVDVKELK